MIHTLFLSPKILSFKIFFKKEYSVMRIKKLEKYLFVIFILVSCFLFAATPKDETIKAQLTEEQKEEIKEKLKKALGGKINDIQIKEKIVENGTSNRASVKNIKKISSSKYVTKNKKTSFLKIDTKDKEVLALVEKYNLTVLKGQVKLLNKIKKSEKLFIKENKLRMKKELLQKKVKNRYLNNEVLRADIAREKNSLKKKKYMIKNFRKNKSIQKNIKMGKVEYTYEPFDKQTGVLKVSDRVIKMPNAIRMGTGNNIIRKINFYANQNDYPIFLVIDMCMGGILTEGQLIMKAVEKSEVPVYVVLKTFAASMAAIIVTSAKYSFVYPNAMMLHHQAMRGAFGNPTQIKDQVRFLDELNRQVFEPIIKKMNLKSIKSIEDLVKMMYKKSIDGNWIEFGDNAVKKYNWANNVVRYIDNFNDGLEEEKQYNIAVNIVAKNETKKKKVKELFYVPENRAYYLYNSNDRFDIVNYNN